MLEKARNYGLENEYNAIGIGADEPANKAQPLAAFTAAALRRMVVEDVRGQPNNVNELFELTKEVRAEAGVEQGAEAAALPEQLNSLLKGQVEGLSNEQVAVVESMLQNPLLQKAVKGNEQEKFTEAMELAKKVANKKLVQVKKVEHFVRGNSNVAANDITEIMEGIPNEPEQIRAALIQMLSHDKEKNQGVIENLSSVNLSDINGTEVKGESVGKIAKKLLEEAKKSKATSASASTTTKAAAIPTPTTTTVTANKAAEVITTTVVNQSASGKVGSTNIDDLTRRVAALEAENAKLKAQLLEQGKGTNTTVERTIERGETNTIKETNTVQPGSTTVIQGRDGKDGKDASPQIQSSSASQQAPETEVGGKGYGPEDIRDSETAFHGSFKTALNIAIVCAILFVLTGGAVGLFLLGALLGGAAAVYYDDKMKTEKRQIATDKNIKHGLVDPAEYQQQQMQQQKSQEIVQLREQLADEQQKLQQMQQKIQDLSQPPATTTVTPPSPVTTPTPAASVSPAPASSSIPPAPPPPPPLLTTADDTAKAAAAIGVTMGQANANTSVKLQTVSPDPARKALLEEIRNPKIKLKKVPAEQMSDKSVTR